MKKTDGEDVVVYGDTREDNTKEFELVSAALASLPNLQSVLDKNDPQICGFKNLGNPYYKMFRNKKIELCVVRWKIFLERKRKQLQKKCYTGRIVLGPTGEANIVFWEDEQEMEKVLDEAAS